jgi:hypothetical protein
MISLESMPIPPAMTCRDVASRLKSILAPHGALVQFRGYESSSNDCAGLFASLIRQEQHNYNKQHADLQLSGCQLVTDCRSPNGGCQEVIIVDAMSFAYSHIKGATLCFVTDKVVEDFSYLLATLHCPQWKTIVISKGLTMPSIICDMKLQWETDVLRLHSSITQPFLPSSPSLGFEPDDILRLAVSEEEEEVHSFTSFASMEKMPTIDEGIGYSVSTPTTSPPSSNTIVRAPTTSNEVLSTVDWNIRGTTATTSNSKVASSSELPYVKQATCSSTATTTSTGVLSKKQAGTSALKEIIVVSYSGLTPSIALSKKPPMALRDVPERVHQISARLPFVLFMTRSVCPKAPNIKAFFSTHSKWSFLLFRTLGDVNLAAIQEPQLKQGTLVDWRRLDDALPTRSSSFSSSTSQPTTNNTVKGPVESDRTVACCQCTAYRRIQPEMIQPPNGEQRFFCSEECYGWGSQEKNLAVRNVVALLGVFAANDDVSVSETFLRVMLYERYFSSNCTSRRLARLWISQAVKVGDIRLFSKNKGGRGKRSMLVCLKGLYAVAKLNNNPHSDDLDTSREEQYVMNLLWSNNGWMTRIDMAERLMSRFPLSMQSCVSRTQVILNAARKKSFYVAHGPYGHTIGLTVKDAEMAMGIAYPPPGPLLPLQPATCTKNVANGKF